MIMKTKKNLLLPGGLIAGRSFTQTFKCMRTFTFLLLVASGAVASPHVAGSPAMNLPVNKLVYQIGIHADDRPAERTVTGKVTDNTGNALAGVTVKIMNSGQGVVTDADGNYTLDQVPDQAILVFSYVGFLSQQVPVKDKSVVNVILQADTKGLGELIVVGYGTQRKIDLTGAVTQISGKEVQNRMTSNLQFGLEGLIPNLNIGITDDGGMPGAKPNINLRGPGSLSGGSPFILVDGIPQDLNTINPNDIESITVLKDASASAIYGVRAAYGVILITTKSGKKNSAPTISYSGNVGWSRPTHLPTPANSLQWAQTINDAAVNSGQAVLIGDDQMTRIRQYLQDPGSIPKYPEGTQYWAGNGISNPGVGNANTNWFKVYYKDWQFSQTHNLNVSGGGDAVKYFISGGYYDQGALFRYGNESYKRYNLTSNITADVTKWLQVGLRTKYVKEKTDMPHAYAGLGSYYHEIPRRWPMTPEKDPNGHFWTYGLVMMTSGGRDITDNEGILNSVNIVITPVKGWSINADFNIKQDLNTYTQHEQTAYWYDYQDIAAPVAYTYPNWYRNTSLKESYNSSNIYSSYTYATGAHHFKALVGFQAELDNYEGVNGLRYNLVSDDVPSLSTATGNEQISGPKGHWATEGYFARLNYDYNEKYLLEISGRYDGTSRFAPGRRWGLFPSLSVGYNIARESFWKDLTHAVSLLKIRASYGSLGNQDVSSNYYPYLASLGVNTNLPWIMGTSRPLYITAPGLVSADLTWETATTLNIGLDASALNDRLSGSFEWYRRETSNMFGPIESYPATLGTKGPQRNNASLVTRGFELSVGWRDRVGPVGYSVQFILSNNRTEVTKYHNESGTLTDYYEGAYLGQIWGYVTRGLYGSDEAATHGNDQSFLYSRWQAGDVEYKDLNGDGRINNGSNTVNDHGDMKIIGNNTPQYNYGLNLSANWKNFDLSLLIQGVAKRDLWLSGNFFWGITGNAAQSTVFVQQLDYWKPDNTNAYFPKPYLSPEAAKNQQPQTKYLQNGAYMRLKNLQLGYDLSSILNISVIRQARVYLSGENLLTFTKLSKVFDPEATGGGWGPGKLYPLSQTLSIGLNLNF
jgi:TonB-linked SusC/RagA family outer membrane protein